MPIWLRALAAQIIALIPALAAMQFAGPPGWPWTFVLLQSLAAAMAAPLLGLPRWWIPIQAAFLPALAVLLRLQLPPVIYLAGFVLLWLVFRSNTRERVPLYLSNRATWEALDQFVEDYASPSFLDLGSGLGGTLRHLAQRHPGGRFNGVESAPLPFLISRLRLLRLDNAHVRLGDLWREDLGRFNLVYAFLSPEPMPALWRKALAEMREGALFVSNSFAVPDTAPTQVLTLNDKRGTRLFIYRMGASATQAAPRFQNK
ncbi:class I SAM-dependent methyltransferase [Methyloterricola oryzae]|uniref:class I SAM-dependent methyltransferase n=1 Tax=Methyloterricola oryzae TaxID=1495050 RepID=UPI0005EB99B6|nr:class I SAM-dependent methyltransferase [Methyloterricola oryzae]